MEVQGVGEAFSGSKKELTFNAVNDGVSVSLFFHLHTCHFIGKKDGCQCQTQDNTICKVIGGDDNGNN